MTRMMLWILALCLVLLFGGVIAMMMTKDAGVMMLTYNGWMVETTFWTGIGLILSTVIIFIVLYALVKRFAPHRLWSNYRNRRSQKVAKKETLIALDSWLKGAEDRSLQALGRVVSAGGSSRLPAAISLAVGMDHGDWMERYAKLIHDDPELKLFADSLHAQRLWQMDQHDDFIDLMLSRFELRQISWLRERFWQSMIQQRKALALIAMVNEAANVQPDLRQHWLIKAASAALEQAHGDPDAGETILKSLSKHQKNLPEFVKAHIAYLMSIDDHEQAFKRFKYLFSIDPANEHIAMLIDIDVDNSLKLTFIESASQLNPTDLFCRTAGVINLRQQLWGTAQGWLEQGWKLGDQQSGYYLATLFEQRNMQDQATRLYRELAAQLI